MLPLVLASASPRREMLLRQIGLEFEIIPSSISESAAELPPSELVQTLALRKARDVAVVRPAALVLGADTVVAIDGTILGKPRDVDEAIQMLEQLSGRCHQVYTGLALVHQYADVERTAAEKTNVWIRRLTRRDIEHYVNTGEPLDKAGAYAAQGRGALLVKRISGCYYNVVGLPLGRLAVMLEDFGIDVFSGGLAASAAKEENPR